MTEAVPIGRMSMATQTDTNRDLIRRAFACINRADFDAAGECVAADLVRNGQAIGREGDRIRDKALAAAFPDLDYTMVDIVAEGDRAAVRWRMTGTHSGDLVGPSITLPASGRQLDIWGISLYRLQNGQVQEIWERFDMMEFLEQLDAGS